MQRSPSFAEKLKNNQQINVTRDIFTNEISLFRLKYVQGTSNTDEPVSQGPFTLGQSTQYEDSIAGLISESKRPNSTLWSLYRQLSDGTPLYVIFTSSETIVWSAECDRDTIKFITGPIERGCAVICETEDSVSLICATRRNGIILVPDIFSPGPVTFDVKSPVKLMCPLFDEEKVIITFDDKTACIFDIESRNFTNIQFSRLARLNYFRNPLISECDLLLVADDTIYGFTSGYITVFDNETFQSVSSLRVPAGTPIAVSQFDGTIFILTDENEVIRVCGAKGDKPLIIHKESVERDVEAFTVAPISAKTCVVCGRWHMKVVSFTDLTAGLKVSESFDNYLLGCWSSDGKIQTLTTRGGATTLIVSEPEETLSQVDLLNTILIKFMAGESIHEALKQYNIRKETFIELDNKIIEDQTVLITQRITTHRMLINLARHAYRDFDESMFASNLLELSILRSAMNDEFDEVTDEFHSAAKTGEINKIFVLVKDRPKLYAEAFLKVLDSAFTEISDVLRKNSKKLRISKNEYFKDALFNCINVFSPEEEMYGNYCRYLALTQQDCTEEIFNLYNVAPEVAQSIVIEARAYSSAARIVEKSRDFSFIERVLKEDGPECIAPIVSYYAEQPLISCLLELGKIKEFRSAVSTSLACDNATLAFNLIQEDSTDKELIEAGSYLCDYVREERQNLSISQAASLVSVGIFCCQAAGQSSVNDQPLNKLKNRAMIYELQKHFGLSNVDIMDSSDLARHAITQMQIGVALSIIGSTYDDRSERENAELLVEAIISKEMSNEELRNILTNTIAAYTIPESLEEVLAIKVDDSAKRDDILRAFRFANAIIHNENHSNDTKRVTLHDSTDKKLSSN